MNSQKRLGLSLTEITIVLGLIGILAVTMLSLNQFNPNDDKLAMTKLAQTDNALMSWSKAQISGNETSLGLSQAIKDQTSLDNAIQEYFNTSENKEGENITITSMTNEKLNGSTLYTLSNGVKLYAQYTLDIPYTSLFGERISATTPIAVFIAVANNNMIEEYTLNQQGQLVNLADLYANRTPQTIQKVTGTNGEPDKYMVCVTTTCTSCSPTSTDCVTIPDDECPDDSCVGGIIYIENTPSSSSCGAGYTGSKTNQRIGSIKGDAITILNSCCLTPTFDKKNGTSATPECVCDQAKMADAGWFSLGEVFNSEDTSTCKRDAQPGEYAAGTTGTAMLCGTDAADNNTGYYCDTKRLSASKLCHKGFYCPQLLPNIKFNSTPELDQNGNYIADVSFVTTITGQFKATGSENDYKALFLETNLKYPDSNTELQGGLKLELKCPKGYYCPNDGMSAPIPCPTGYYCPEEGMTEALPCPIGTYNDKTTAMTKDACKSCPTNSTTESEGAGNINNCKCKAGYYVESIDTNCNLEMTADVVECIEVGDEYYSSATQNCRVKCPEHSYTGITNATNISACKCRAGYYVASFGTDCGKAMTDNITACTEVEADAYSGDMQNCKVNCPDHSGTNNQTKQTAVSDCKCKAGYYTDDSCSALNGANLCNITPTGTYSTAYNNCKSNCPAGTHGVTTGGTSEQTACENCACGQYSGEGAAICTDCADGYYASEGSASCTRVDTNFVVSNNKCTQDCPAGYALANNTCTKCKAGTYNGSINSTCTTCECAKYSLAGATSCTSCPPGQYAPRGSSSASYCHAVTTNHVITTDQCGQKCKTLAELQPLFGASDYYNTSSWNCISSCSAPRYIPNPSNPTSCICPPQSEISLADGEYYTTSATICKSNCTLPQIPNSAKTGCECPGADNVTLDADEYYSASSSTCKRDCPTPKVHNAAKTDCECPGATNVTLANSEYYNPSSSTCKSSCATPKVHADNRVDCVCPGASALTWYSWENKKYYDPASSTCKSDCTNPKIPTSDRLGCKCPSSCANDGYTQDNTTCACTCTRSCGSGLRLTSDCTCKEACPEFGTVYIFYAGYTSSTTVGSMCNANSNSFYNSKTITDSSMISICNKISAENKELNVYYNVAIFKEDGSLLEYLRNANPNGSTTYTTSSGHTIKFSTSSTLTQSVGQASKIYSGGTMIYDGDCKYSIGRYMYQSDPVILDLKGNGIKLTSAENGVRFDIDGDGIIDQTAWTDEQTEFDDAFLCLDKNGNGKIDNGTELFGDQQGAATGLDELAKYDTHNTKGEAKPDGIITKEDPIYNQLLLWVDFNKNGVTDKNELKKLSDLNITELSTEYTTKLDENGEEVTDEHGNKISVRGTFKQLVEEIVDGVATLIEKIGEIIDAFFQVIVDLFE